MKYFAGIDDNFLYSNESYIPYDRTFHEQFYDEIEMYINNGNLNGTILEQ